MTAIPWIQSGERVVGRGHATLTDVDNRPLRTLLQLSGYDPDALFSGLAGPVFNVKAYGAVGNGGGDDSAAIQAALNACGAAGGGIVFFPQGIYNVASATLNPSANTTIRGVHRMASTLKNSLSPAVWLITNSNTDITIENLGFIKGGAFSSRGIQTTSIRTTVRNCYFNQESISATSGSRDLTVVDSVFEGKFDAIVAAGCSGVTVAFNKFNDVWSAIRVTTLITTLADVERVRILYNEITDCNDPAHPNPAVLSCISVWGVSSSGTYAVKDVLVHGNIIRGSVITGIDIRENVQRAQITHNHISEITDPLSAITCGIRVRAHASTPTATHRPLHTLIDSNHVENTAGIVSNDCISVFNADDTVITNNIVRGASSNCVGIHVYTQGTGDNYSRRTRVAGNNVQGCADGIYMDTANVIDSIFGQNWLYNNTWTNGPLAGSAYGQIQDDRISDDRGDTSPTLNLVDGAVPDAMTQIFATALTNNRTVTLPNYHWKGARFRIVRTGLGAFTLNVGGLKTIPSGTAAYVDVQSDGTVWKLTGYGLL